MLTDRIQSASPEESNGTSFHGDVINLTLNEIIDTLGYPTHGASPSGKTHYAWTFRLDDGEIFTIYDWKLLFPPNNHDTTPWNIGSHTVEASRKAYKVLNEIFFTQS